MFFKKKTQPQPDPKDPQRQPADQAEDHAEAEEGGYFNLDRALAQKKAQDVAKAAEAPSATPAPTPEPVSPDAQAPAPPAQPVVEPEPEPLVEMVVDAESEAESEPALEPEEDTAPAPVPEDRPGLFRRMFSRLGKTRDKIGGSIDRITLGKHIDDEVLDELEEVLVTADLGVKVSLELIERMRQLVRRRELDDAQALKRGLAQGILEVLEKAAPAPQRDGDPHVIMVVGVNGVGKTTTIGKLAHRWSGQGRKVLLAAGDTFRAAAGEQLQVWAQRANTDIVRQKEGADPSAVAFDALEAAQRRHRDLVIIDTAGRLHTKVDLMDELKKIHRVVAKKLPGAPHEVILVVDATTGQNALQQAKLFHQVVPLTGLVLTKLDGTAKGGVAVAITAELELPILYVGLGEKIDDLRPFDPEAYAAAVVGLEETPPA